MSRKRITIGHFAGPDVKPDPVTLDIEKLLKSKLMVQANSGGGKSNTIRLLVENLSPILPCVTIDPEGEFATLREKVDLVLVGEGGELAATPQNAGELALKLLSLGVSAVVDLFGLVPDDRRQWVRRYCENILAAPRKLWRPFVLLIDEAQMFCPQDSESVSTGPLTLLMTLSRKRGICPILVTPRFAQVSTDARAPVNNFLIGRATLDVDYKRAGEILGMPREERRTLASLKEGQFHGYGPAFGHDGVRFMQLDLAETKEAKAGAGTAPVPAPSAAIKAVVPELEALAKPKDPDDVATIEAAKKRIGELNKLVKAAEREAQRAAKAVPAPVVVSESPKAGELKAARAAVARLTRLQEDLVKFIINIQARDFSEDAGVDPAKLEAAVRQATEQAAKIIEATLRARAQQVKQLKADAARLVERANAISGGLPKEVTVEVAVTKNKPFTVAPRLPTAAPRPPSQDGLDSRPQRFLDAAAALTALDAEVTRETVCGWVGVHPRGGSVGEELKVLVEAGFIELDRGAIKVTPAGLSAANASDQADAVESAKRGLSPRQQRIFDIVCNAYPESIARDAVAELMGIHPRGGSFGEDIGRLAGRGLIQSDRGQLKAREFLFAGRA